ncbi:MAG: hypothetical protein KDB00_10620 [Planctomycetales bacterium]|nr:hypothetical protein [Planctomycetales bacterium]
MNETFSWVWFIAGIMAGCAHATMLWRATRRMGVWSPLVGMLRLGLVAVLLVMSALSGQILSSAAGWAIGLATLGTFLVMRPGGGADDHSRVPCK